MSRRDPLFLQFIHELDRHRAFARSRDPSHCHKHWPLVVLGAIVFKLGNNSIEGGGLCLLLLFVLLEGDGVGVYSDADDLDLVKRPVGLSDGLLL